MKKVIRLTEGDLVRIVKRIVKESDKENGGYDYLKNHTNVNLDSIINFDEESYDDVDDFLNDVFPSAETFLQDFYRLYPVKDYLHKLFDIMEDSFGIEGGGVCIGYIYEWNDKRK